MAPRTLLCALALLLLPAVSAAAQGGTGPRVVRAGMTEAEAVAALGTPVEVRTWGEWRYLYYLNGCAVLCGTDDVVFVRRCTVVAGILRHASRRWEGEAAHLAMQHAPEGACAPIEGRPVPEAERPVPPGDVADRTPPPTRTAPGRLNPPPGTAQDAEAFRRALRLPYARRVVQAIPAGSISTPTAFGLDAGEGFVGVGFQHRTRYTDDADAAAVAGLGFGHRHHNVGVEVAVTSYSTLRGDGPGETGGVSVKLHRVVGNRAGVAVGFENALDWGNTDGGNSLFAVASGALPLRPERARYFTALVASLGVGNGRFRTEEQVRDDEDTANLFGSLGLRVVEPMSLVADWTGQDLNLGVSVSPFRAIPLTLNAGVADVTRTAGDGPRIVASVGYGFLVPVP